MVTPHFCNFRSPPTHTFHQDSIRRSGVLFIFAKIAWYTLITFVSNVANIFTFTVFIYLEVWGIKILAWGKWVPPSTGPVPDSVGDTWYRKRGWLDSLYDPDSAVVVNSPLDGILSNQQSLVIIWSGGLPSSMAVGISYIYDMVKWDSS